MKELLELIARSLVTQPEAVRVQEDRHDHHCRLRLQVAPEDMGKVIGKGGQVARAIRLVMRAAAVHEGVTLRVDIGDGTRDGKEEDAARTGPVQSVQAVEASGRVEVSKALSAGTAPAAYPAGTVRPAWARRRRPSRRVRRGRALRPRPLTDGVATAPNYSGSQNNGQGSERGGGSGEEAE